MLPGKQKKKYCQFSHFYFFSSNFRFFASNSSDFFRCFSSSFFRFSSSFFRFCNIKKRKKGQNGYVSMNQIWILLVIIAKIEEGRRESRYINTCSALSSSFFFFASSFSLFLRSFSSSFFLFASSFSRFFFSLGDSMGDGSIVERTKMRIIIRRVKRNRMSYWKGGGTYL